MRLALVYIDCSSANAVIFQGCGQSSFVDEVATRCVDEKGSYERRNHISIFKKVESAKYCFLFGAGSII